MEVDEIGRRVANGEMTAALAYTLLIQHIAPSGESIIGKYAISVDPHEPKRVNIFREGGEGGTFDIDLFEQAIKEFYDKNF